LIEDPNAGLERFLIYVDFSGTDDADTASGILQSRLWMATDDAGGYSSDEGFFVIDGYYGPIQPRLTLEPRRKLYIEQTRPVGSFSRDIPLDIGLRLIDSIYEGYVFENDLVNFAQPYLEVACGLAGDPDGEEYVELSQGLRIRYGDSNSALSKTDTGRILFMRDQGLEYDMRDSHTGGSLTAMTDVSLELDFSQALAFNFEANRTYFIIIGLYRTSEPDLPLSGRPVQTLTIPVRIESDLEYGFRLDADKAGLAVNLNGIASDGSAAPELTFTARYSNIKENSENTRAVFRLYRKNGAGEYELCEDDEALRGLSLKLTYGDGSFITRSFAGGEARFYPWRYVEGLEASYYSEAAVYGSGPDTVALGTVTVDIHEDEIEAISLTDGGLPVEGYDALLSEIREENGVEGITQTLTPAEYAVVLAAGAILDRIRTGLADDGDGVGVKKGVMSLTGFDGELELGNYRLEGSLQVNGVEVAGDYFIFNVNKNRLFDPIQAASD